MPSTGLKDLYRRLLQAATMAYGDNCYQTGEALEQLAEVVLTASAARQRFEVRVLVNTVAVDGEEPELGVGVRAPHLAT